MKRAFRLPTSRRRIGDELDDELRFHLEGRIEDLMAREGLSRAAAEDEARRRFGNYESYRREAHEIDEIMIHRRNKMELLDAIRRETRGAIRSLLRAPAFSLIAIVTLALGLGAATTIFTLLDRVVLRPLPYPNADRLVNLGTAWPKVKAGTEYGISRGQYFYFRKNSSSLSDVLFYDGGVMVVAGDGVHAAERVDEVSISASAFAMLGIKPEHGRLFTESEEQWSRGARLPAVITHEYWQNRFGGDPAVVGRNIDSDDDLIQIVGILPPGTALPDAAPSIWVPNRLVPSEAPQNNHTHTGIGLLKPGVTIEAAQADLRRVQERMQQEYPNVYGPTFLERTGFAIHLTSVAERVVGSTVTRALWLVFAAVGFVLLIATGNVANLFLVRIDARRREVALRRALGADAGHLAIHYVAESVALALAAGLLAMVLGDALLRIVLAIAPQSLPRLSEVAFDWRSATFCLTTAMLFGLAFGLLPLGAGKADASMLRDGARGITASKASELLRRGLVLTQVALAVVLLAGAGLMVKTFAQLRAVKPGFDPVGVQTMSIIIPTSYEANKQVVAFWHELTRRVEAIPGVEHAGAASDLPLGGEGGCNGIVVDVVNSAGEKGQCMPFRLVTPGYFEALRYDVRGKMPTWADVEAGTGPLVVTKGFAERFWEKTDAIGHGVEPFNPQFPFFPIVGVTSDVREAGLQSAASQMAYFPIAAPSSAPMWRTGGSLTMVIRAPSLSSSTIVQRVRGILSELEPKALIVDAEPMEARVARSMAQTSFTMLLLLIAATIALLLSAVGIYGVISYLVGQRRGEIGVRMALGAQSGQVVSLIVRRSLGLAIAGVVLGLFASVASTRALQSLLFGVTPTDPAVLAGTALVLLLVAAVASAAPARRAARIDPVEAMRAAS